MIWTRPHVLASVVLLSVVMAVVLPLTLSERVRPSPTIQTARALEFNPPLASPPTQDHIAPVAESDKSLTFDRITDRKRHLRPLIEKDKLAAGTIVSYDNQFAFRKASVGDQLLLDDGTPLLWKNVPVTYAGRESDSIAVAAREKMDLLTEMGRAEQTCDNALLVVFSAGATHCVYRTIPLDPGSSQKGISEYEKSTVEIEMKVAAWDLGQRNDTLSAQEKANGLRTAFTGDSLVLNDGTPLLHNGANIRYKWVWPGTMGYITYLNSVPERGPRLQTIEEHALRSLNNDLISLPETIVLGDVRLTVEYAGPYSCVYCVDKIEK